MSSAATQNVVRLSISQAAPLVLRCISVHRPVFLHGPPGIGKSALGHAIAASTSRPMIDMRLSIYDPSDLKGVPHLDFENGTMRWATPDELPRAGRTRSLDSGFHRQHVLASAESGDVIIDDDGTVQVSESVIREFDEKDAILFLDELNSAPQSVQAAAYQLVLDRKLGSYTLPKNVSLIAAGNRANDRGVANRMPSPLANRFAHIEIQPVFDDWVEWASKVGIRPEIIGFLSTARSNWNTFEQSKDAIAFATPRSWDFVSQTLYDDADQDTAFNLTAMYVGAGIAQDFVSYRELALKVPNTRSIFEGSVPDITGMKINILYTLAYNLMYGLRDMVILKGNNDPGVCKAVDNTLRFVAEHMPPELAVLMSQSLVKNFGLRLSPALHPSVREVFWPKVQKYVR